MLSCVFCWSQYLRVLILSCLSCSIAVIMVVTSTQTDRQSIYGVCHKWLNGALHGLWGIAARKLRHIRPHGNFMLSDVPVCLPSSCLSSMNDESIFYHFPISGEFANMLRKRILFRRRHKSEKDSFMMIVDDCLYFVVETTPLNQGTGSIFGIYHQ